MKKRVAALHDLSCFGRGSLATVMPVLSSFGVQVCPLPSSLLSTHTGGFEDFFFLDLTKELEQILNHWEKLGIKFHGIYTGFLSGESQFPLALRLIQSFALCDGLICVDPVMGDEGALYSTYTKDMITNMRKLVGQAHIITPNYTEACFLTEEEPKQNPTKKELETIGKKLLKLGAKASVITGIEGENKVSIAIISQQEPMVCFSTPKVEGTFPGAGDLFCSLLLGYLLLGLSLQEGAKKASEFCFFAMKETKKQGKPYKEGLYFEGINFLA